jgi:Na+-translocating ferredoxin:NAD+ oxidoreductase RnfA subunit
MQKVRAKVSEMRERASTAIEDVPDNLIGTLLVLIVLTVLGLGLLMFLGFLATR